MPKPAEQPVMSQTKGLDSVIVEAILYSERWDDRMRGKGLWWMFIECGKKEGVTENRK